jgi:pantetheine-phosphate adenylyltransferase
MAERATARIAIFPGSFDPLTNGHIDIIQRSAKLFDKVIVAVLTNSAKTPLFSADERMEIIRENFPTQPNVEADTFEGLLVDYARAKQANVIVRGLRGIADFEYELQMAMMNRHLDESVETVFMMPAEQYTYVSSRLMKEVMSLGGSITGLVPAGVERRLAEKSSGSSLLKKGRSLK